MRLLMRTALAQAASARSQGVTRAREIRNEIGLRPLLATDARLSLRAMTALAALLGVYHGYCNGAGLGQFTTAAGALVGLSFGLFAIVALAAAFTVPLRAQWSRIAVRVAGRWIAASGLLLAAWAVRTA